MPGSPGVETGTEAADKPKGTETAASSPVVVLVTFLINTWNLLRLHYNDPCVRHLVDMKEY